MKKICVIFGACLSLLFLSRCQSGGHSNRNDTNSAGVSSDSAFDAKNIVKKINALEMSNKWDEALSYASANLHRFSGNDKAMLLNERGGAYLLKDDPNNAISDYLAASDLEPDSPQYMVNVATTYEGIGSASNAVLFAKRILELPSASDSDKVLAAHVIERGEQSHNRQ